MHEKSKRVVLTEDVREYRSTIPFFVTETDSVLEVGCALGTTSRLLSRQARRLVAVDKSALIDQARAVNPHIHFEQADAFDVGAMIKLGPFDKIYVDLSGSRRPEPIMALVRAYLAAIQPKVVVVKNIFLKLFIEESIVWRR